MKLTDTDRLSRYTEIDEIGKSIDKFSRSIKIKLNMINDLYRNEMELLPNEISDAVIQCDLLSSELSVMHNEIEDFVKNVVQRRLIDTLAEVTRTDLIHQVTNVYITYTNDMSFNQCIAHTLRFISETLGIPVWDKNSVDQSSEVLLIENITLDHSQRVLLENSGFIDAVKYINI